MSQSVGKVIQEAMVLDNNQDFTGAFEKYVESMHFIFSRLYSSEDDEKSKTEMQLNLANQCLERAINVLKQVDKRILRVNERRLTVDLGSKPSSPSHNRHKSCSSDQIYLEGDLKESSKQASDLPLKHAESRSSLSEELEVISKMGPVSTQKQKNMLLWNSFHEKVKELQSKGKVINPEMNLRFAKKLQESLVEAELKEKSLMSQVYAKYKQSAQSEKSKRVLRDLINLRVPVKKGQSKEFIENLNKKVESFEFDAKIKKDEESIRRRLQEAQNEQSLVLEPIVVLLSYNRHPISKDFREFLKKSKKSFDKMRSLSKISNEVLDGLLFREVEEIHSYVYNLIEYLKQTYSQLDNDDASIQCQFSIQRCIFTSPIYVCILDGLKIKYREKDSNLSDKISKIIWDCNLQSMNIKKKFWLGLEFEDVSNSLIEPYLKPIEHLRQISTLREPLDKLECLVRANESICAAFVDYYTSKGKNCTDLELAIGGEDLHALCAYVMIKANVPFAFSELMFIAEFIPDRFILGEEGYALASMQAALETILEL